MTMKNKLAGLLLLLATPLFAQVNGNFNNVTAKGDYSNSHAVVIPGGTTGDHGTGPKLQMSDGTGTAGNVAVFDANGNVIDGNLPAGLTWAIHDVTSSRVAGTVYQNTSTNPMFIGGNAGTPNGAVVFTEIDQGPSSGSLIFKSWAVDYGATVSSGHAGFTATIMPGYFYRLSTGSATGIDSWIEITATGSTGGGGGGGGGGTDAHSIWTNPVSSAGPVNKAMLIWNASASQYDVRPLTLDDIAPAFGISTFTCSMCSGTPYEVGFTVASPTNFTASYTSAATSGTVSDGTNSTTLSPANSTSQSGNLAHSYTSATAATVTFTLTAIGSTTQTRSATFRFSYRYFGGIGSAGATNSVTASGTTAILSTGNSLASVGLSDSQVGVIFPTYTLTNQKIYLLLIGNSHTLIKDNLTGFTLPFGTPTSVSFVNANGATVPMYLYESVNLLTGPFQPWVTN